MTILLAILFAVCHLEFVTTDRPREKIIIPEIYTD